MMFNSRIEERRMSRTDMERKILHTQEGVPCRQKNKGKGVLPQFDGTSTPESRR